MNKQDPSRETFEAWYPGHQKWDCLTMPNARYLTCAWDAWQAAYAAGMAAEREACAELAERHQHDCYEGDIDWHEAGRIAAAIRTREASK